MSGNKHGTGLFISISTLAILHKWTNFWSIYQTYRISPHASKRYCLSV